MLLGGLIILVRTCCVVSSLFELEFFYYKMTALCGVGCKGCNYARDNDMVLCL